MKNKKIQKRSIEIIENEDGSYEIIGGGWDIKDLDFESVEEAFNAWKTGKFDFNSKIKPPRILEKSHI